MFRKTAQIKPMHVKYTIQYTITTYSLSMLLKLSKYTATPMSDPQKQYITFIDSNTHSFKFF